MHQNDRTDLKCLFVYLLVAYRHLVVTWCVYKCRRKTSNLLETANTTIDGRE